jgi:dihydrofolate synthase/folylpolyglutamate synthase
MTRKQATKHSDYKNLRIHDYDSAIEYLYSLELFGIKLGLDNVSRLLQRLGNPHTDKKFIHVAGTNGKGSVCAMLASILKEAGYNVGLYTSPHLSSFRERIQLNGEKIPRDYIIAITPILQKHALEVEAETGAHPTYFEIVTAMALKFFHDNNVDIAILEVGMGGRFDATNVITPEISVINDISMDHMEYLGDTPEKIAFEKAGIIKTHVPTILSDHPPEVFSVIEKIAEENSSRLFILGKDFDHKLLKSTKKGLELDFIILDDFKFDEGSCRSIGEISIPLIGNFQAKNCAIAVAAILLLRSMNWKIRIINIFDGLKKVRWPGRIHIVQESPTVILDSSHNPVSIKNLVETVQDNFEFEKLICVIGVVKEKDRGAIVKELAVLSPEVVAVRPDTHRALEPEILQEEFRDIGIDCIVIPDVIEGVKKAVSNAKSSDLVIITGSFYTAGAAWGLWQNENEG